MLELVLILVLILVLKIALTQSFYGVSLLQLA